MNQEIVEKTMAPDLQSYETVVQENKNLHEELSLKDRVIEALQKEKAVLQETVKHLTETVQEWKKRFDQLAHRAGRRLMSAFGFGKLDDPSISDLPDPGVAEVLSDMKEDAMKYDPAALRIITDPEDRDRYQIVHRTRSGEYEPVRTGFKSREHAEKARREYIRGQQNLCEEQRQSQTEKVRIR